MALTRAQKTRGIRQQALREQLSTQCHVQHMLDALTKMQQLAEGSIDQEAKDRFAMYAALADRHWKIVDKYLPALPRPEAEQEHGLFDVLATINHLVGKVTDTPTT